MICPGENVLVGFSGGADSVCLLELLRRFREAGSLTGELRAVHVHHGLRRSAEEDVRFVREFCDSRNIPLEVFHVDARAEARQRGMSIEEAGRHLRRGIYMRTASGMGPGTKIALAHHREDSAETLLFNLCRGSSLEGLCGIRPVSVLESESAEGGAAICIIRPLIRSSRTEIEEWLTSNRLSWRTDETNEDMRYTRNYLRRHIFPELKSHVNAASEEHMARTALELSEAEAFLREQTREAAETCSRTGPQGEREYFVSKLAGLPLLLQKRVLHLALTQAEGGARDISETHVRALQSLMKAEGSASVDLPGGLTAQKEYDRLFFCTKGGQEALPDAGWPLSEEEYEVRILPYTGEVPPSGRYTKWIDYDKMFQPLQLRTRREGDRIAIESRSGGEDKGRQEAFHYKKLSRAMIDRKVPARLREQVVLPMDGNEVLWFPGWRISARHRVRADTQKVLEIRWKGGINQEESNGKGFGDDYAGRGRGENP